MPCFETRDREHFPDAKCLTCEVYLTPQHVADGQDFCSDECRETYYYEGPEEFEDDE